MRRRALRQGHDRPLPMAVAATTAVARPRRRARTPTARRRAAARRVRPARSAAALAVICRRTSRTARARPQSTRPEDALPTSPRRARPASAFLRRCRATALARRSRPHTYLLLVSGQLPLEGGKSCKLLSRGPCIRAVDCAEEPGEIAVERVEVVGHRARRAVRFIARAFERVEVRAHRRGDRLGERELRRQSGLR